MSYVYINYGRIDGDYLDEEGCDISGEFYDDKIFQVETAIASGRVTTKMYKVNAKEDSSEYNEYLDNDDYVLKCDNFNCVGSFYN